MFIFQLSSDSPSYGAISTNNDNFHNFILRIQNYLKVQVFPGTVKNVSPFVCEKKLPRTTPMKRISMTAAAWL
jgi:hypothetical protein